MAAAEHPKLLDAMLLLSYPLHPPGKPEQARTQHFGELKTPAMFAHGTRDSFGTVDQMRAAIQKSPARTELLIVEGAPHGLPAKSAKMVAENFVAFLRR